MIIDSHAHIFPDKIAEKASMGIGEFYGMEMRFDGRLSTLFDLGQKAGVEKFVVHSVATAPEQVETINNYIAECVRQYPDKLVGYAAIHPDCSDVGGELDRAFALGLKGVKIHPDFQRFHIDGEKAMRIYRHIEGKKPILVHTGDYRYDWSKPARMAKVLDAFPNLTAIGAHFGGWSEWDEAAEVLAGYENFYVDTSSSLYALTPEKARRLIVLFGIDRVLFGTDYPMWNPSEEINMLNGILLDETEREKVYCKNLTGILNIEL